MIAPAFAAQVLDNSNKGQFIGSNGALLGHDGSGGRGDRYDYELGESLELERRWSLALVSQPPST